MKLFKHCADNKILDIPLIPTSNLNNSNNVLLTVLPI